GPPTLPSAAAGRAGSAGAGRGAGRAAGRDRFPCMRGTTSPASQPSPPARRALLSGALGVAGLALSGCGIRLEDSAPEIPFIPTREPIPAEPALLWLLQDCRGLAFSGGGAVRGARDESL